MLKPASLKSGDTIGVCAPSSRIAPEDIDAATLFLEERGYKVFIHPQCYNAAPALSDRRFTQYAGTAQQKADALHELVRNPDIKAIFFAAGGQRAMTVLDLLDYDLIKANPKIFMGFSDGTLLLNAITAYTGLITYHGPTFKRLLKNPQARFNLSLLEGNETTIPLTGAQEFCKGQAEGILIGGNMTLLCAMTDRDLPETKGALLFLEDINEELTTFDRNLCALRRRGILETIGGLILGQFTNMLDTGTPFGLSFENIIAEHTQGLNLPILINAPFGHAADLPVFPIGQKARLTKTELELLT